MGILKSYREAKRMTDSGIMDTASEFLKAIKEINDNQLKLEQQIITLQNNQVQINDCLNNMEKNIKKLVK